jgi:hypothetical protein
MANEQQFRVRTTFVATRGVEEYRASIPAWVKADDSVLEIGCEWGTTTTLLARHCKELIGTDISDVCLRRARELYPELRFEQLDAFDLRAALRFQIPFSAIYIDVSGLSGYRSLLDVIALLNMYATVFDPRVIVVKSGALKQFASRCVAWQMPRDCSVHAALQS